MGWSVPAKKLYFGSFAILGPDLMRTLLRVRETDPVFHRSIPWLLSYGERRFDSYRGFLIFSGNIEENKFLSIRQ